MLYLLVFLGGGIGSMLRHGVNVATAPWLDLNFPFGTLTVNVTGSIVMGLLAGYFAFKGAPTQHGRLFLMTGVLGGFTTFSSFGSETLNLARDSQMMSALANLGANVILGLLAFWLGRTISYLIWR